MKKKQIAQLMIPVVVGGIMPTTYAGAEVIQLDRSQDLEKQLNELGIDPNRIEVRNQNEDKNYSYWMDNNSRLTDVVKGSSNNKELCDKVSKVKIVVRAYKAGTNEYLGESEGINEGIYIAPGSVNNKGEEIINVEFTPPATFKGYYSSAYSKLESYYLAGCLIREEDYTYSFLRVLTNSELSNGIAYVNMYYYDDIQNGWIQKNGKWYYLDEGEYTQGWSTAAMSKKKNERYTGVLGYIDVSTPTWFYFDSNGVMQTGWKLIDGKWYYFYENGTMARNTTINGYKIDSNGVWIK